MGIKSTLQLLFCKHTIKQKDTSFSLSVYDVNKLEKPQINIAEKNVVVICEKKLSKLELVKKHLLEKGSIDSWTAITLYKATRLSSIIYTLKNTHGLNIETKISKDKSHFATYFLNQDK